MRSGGARGGEREIALPVSDCQLPEQGTPTVDYVLTVVYVTFSGKKSGKREVLT